MATDVLVEPTATHVVLKVGGDEVTRLVRGRTVAQGEQSAAIAALTDNTAGTANNTLQALTDPANTPATADELRDDLVANLIPELRNNLADLGAKVNAILAALRAYNIIAT